MKEQIEIEIGAKFGDMTVISKDPNKKLHYFCKCSCGNTKSIIKYTIITNIKSGANSSCGKCRTFEKWCLENNHQDFLDLWDYELNIKSPSEIPYGTRSEYYFKCEEGIHNSELFSINKITIRNHKPNCRACGTFGHYLLENNELDMWSPNDELDAFSVRMGSDTKHLLVCPICKREKKIAPSTYRLHGLGCTCGDGNSYPNKLMANVLMQLNLEFETEKIFDWSDNKRYDIYITHLNCIIENHGIQHYIQSKRGRSLEDEQANDILKQRIANDNGVKHYIVLDCRKSEIGLIKNSIMKSELPKLLNFKEEDINWDECEVFANKNLVLEACDLYKTLDRPTPINISKILQIDRRTVTEYLKKGSKLGMCNYDPKIAMKDPLAKSRGAKNPNSKKVFCENRVFDTISECAKFYNIPISSLGNYLRGNRPMPEKFIKLGLSFYQHND